MSQPTVVLCTLVLNEMQWLQKLFEQHINWPGLLKWVFIEAADTAYATTNPRLVNKDGLSVDGTTGFLEGLMCKTPLVTHVKHGFSKGKRLDQGKCAARQRYLQIANMYEPDMLIILDADEFWPESSQQAIGDIFQTHPDYLGYCIRHREVWHPPSCADKPLFTYEVNGGFWSIPYVRCWRWQSGLQYSKNHNTPEGRRGLLDTKLMRLETTEHTPEFIHMGFAALSTYRLAKNNYYRARGEGKTDKRQWYVESRAAWENWKPGHSLPHGAKVLPYSGTIPEVFQPCLTQS